MKFSTHIFLAAAMQLSPSDASVNELIQVDLHEQMNHLQEPVEDEKKKDEKKKDEKKTEEKKTDECEDADCDATTIVVCEKLWEEKKELCEEKKEEWAGLCPAPTYTDADGNQRNCKRGCCSEKTQDKIQEELAKVAKKKKDKKRKRRADKKDKEESSEEGSSAKFLQKDA